MPGNAFSPGKGNKARIREEFSEEAALPTSATIGAERIETFMKDYVNRNPPPAISLERVKEYIRRHQPENK